MISLSASAEMEHHIFFAREFGIIIPVVICCLRKFWHLSIGIVKLDMVIACFNWVARA